MAYVIYQRIERENSLLILYDQSKNSWIPKFADLLGLVQHTTGIEQLRLSYEELGQFKGTDPDGLLSPL